jgi:shikimate kinase
MTIILIGPMKVGKSTVARLLSKRLGLPRRALDKNRWKYFGEIGYDEEHFRRLAEHEGIAAAVSYWKPFEVHAVERHLAEAHDCVADFGAGYTVQQDALMHERVALALASHPHVVLLLPSADVEDAIRCLADRVPEELRPLNAHYIRHPANRMLAKSIVYTSGKSPEETCEEVLRTLGLNARASGAGESDIFPRS